MEIIKEIKRKFGMFCKKSLRVGFFLAVRQLKGASFWSTFFIIFIMFLTFLNLIVVNGILIGLVEGSSISYRSQYSGDILISSPENKSFIKDSRDLLKKINLTKGVKEASPRIITGGKIIYNYKRQLTPPDLPDQVSAEIAGINPELEDKVTNLSKLIINGENLNKGDNKYVLIGSSLLKKYFEGFPGGEYLEKEVDVGSKIKIIIGDTEQEVTIKGVVESKIGNVGGRVYFLDSWLEKIIEKERVNEIAIKLEDGFSPESVKEDILSKGIKKEDALIQTWEESQGQFFEDIKGTFSILSNLIGLIGIVVTSITLFIVIFINAISREKFIGILKGIGICSEAIEISYILQSFFYVLSGTAFGLLVLYGFLKPYIDKNPIDFPFSDGILVAPLESVSLRIIILLIITAIASYIPSKIVINKNTLDSILGRK